MKIFVPVGCDCSIAYQLSQLGLRGVSYPLDWCSSPHLDTIIQLFENNFKGFEKFDKYQIKPQSQAMFNTNLETSLLLDETMKSYNKLYHLDYKITLPHEYVGNNINSRNFEEKYTRRVARLLSLLDNMDNEIIFIRLGNNKEKTKIKELEKTLQARCKCKFNILFINYDDYKTDHFTWQRDYIPWKSLLTS